VASGGVDQAAGVVPVADAAPHIAFNPPAATSVVLPEHAAFVVAHPWREVLKALRAAQAHDKRGRGLRAARRLRMSAEARAAVTRLALLDLRSCA
jgi:hypothetical protein